LPSARAGAAAKAVAAAATTTELMDHHNAGRPTAMHSLTSAGLSIDEAERGEPDRRSHCQAPAALDHPPETGEVQ